MFANILIKRFIGQYGVKNEDESNNVIDAEYIEINDEDEK
jgi:hypothetical protein